MKSTTKGRPQAISITLNGMRVTILERLGITQEWAQETALAVIALSFGFAVLPLLIFLAGSTLLGRYDGASAGVVYGGLYGGLRTGSTASWGVFLGPYGLYLLFKGLRLWWRASLRLA